MKLIKLLIIYIWTLDRRRRITRKSAKYNQAKAAYLSARKNILADYPQNVECWTLEQVTEFYENKRQLSERHGIKKDD